MRPVVEWDEADLRTLIDARVQESDTLDFKRSAALNRTSDGRLGLSKMVSSLANAAGGVLVFGIIEDKHFATDIDGGLDPDEMSKETVDQMISTSIQPRVDGYKIKQIWLTGDREGRVAYAIEVPQATTFAPHQASDKKYYKRSNFESVAMADYEIRDALRRGATPALYLDVTLTDSKPGTEGALFGIDFVIGNRSEEPALYWALHVYLDKRLGPATLPDFKFYDEGELSTYGAHRYALYRMTRVGVVPNTMPLFREMSLKLGRIDVEAPVGQGFGIAYELICPGFLERRSGSIFVLPGRSELHWGDGPEG